jgi:hypothetical protein
MGISWMRVVMTLKYRKIRAGVEWKLIFGKGNII